MITTDPLLAASMGDLGFGGVAGLAVGYTAKKLTKLAAIILGVTFITVQILSHVGWIAVDWGFVQQQTEQALATEGGRTLIEESKAIVTANLPFAGSFLAGLAIGYKVG